MWVFLLWVVLVIEVPISTSAFVSTSAFASTTAHKRTNDNSPTTRGQKACSRLHATTHRVLLRDWNKGDGHAIYDLLVSAEEYGSFNPEGALELDCETELLLSESYNVEDGGCFLVAELLLKDEGGDGKEENQEYSSSNTQAKDGRLLVGTAGLIVGTPIQYQTSGSSMSSPEITAAVRRCVVCLPAAPQQQSSASSNAEATDTGTASAIEYISAESIQRKLLVAIEERAVQAKATQLIGLAYSPFKSSSASPKGVKPTLHMMHELGYKTLPQQLPGVDALQCGKDLTTK